MSPAAAERKWVLTRIEAGDYILPSNDGRTIWRLASYDEEGRARKPWGLWRFRGRAEEFAHDPLVDVASWDAWEMVASDLDTRQAAIDEAMRIGGAL